MAQVAPGCITAVERTDGVGATAICAAVVGGAAVLTVGATGAVMAGVALVGETKGGAVVTGGEGVLGGGGLGAAGGGVALSVSNKASTVFCVKVRACRPKPDWMSHNKATCNTSTRPMLGRCLRLGVAGSS